MTRTPDQDTFAEPMGRSRRSVLATLAAAGSAVATAGILPAHAQQTPEQPETPAEHAEGAGYSLTEHVRRYYALARF